MKKFTAIFAGAGIGALLGLLIGMSVSNTVSVVIGSLASILVILLGLQDKENRDLHALRIGSFGLVCAAASLMGVYIRANNFLSPSVNTQVQNWTADSLFTIEESKKFVLFERLGIISTGIQLDTSTANNHLNSVFFAAEVSPDVCGRLAHYKSFTIDEQLAGYRLEGGRWKKIADSVSVKVVPAQQKNILNLIQTCLCDAN